MLLQLIVAGLAFLIGAGLAWMIWDETPDYGYNSEYPSFWWTMWGLLGAGVLIVMAAIWSVTSEISIGLVALGLVSMFVGAAFGTDDGEFASPLAPMGFGWLLVGLAFLFLPITNLSSGMLALVFGVAGIFCVGLGAALRSNDSSGYDVSYMLGYVALGISLTILFGWLETPLDDLNKNHIAEFNEVLAVANDRHSSYDSMLAQAQTDREIIALEFADETTMFVDQADTHLNQAATYHQQASNLADRAGEPQEERSSFSKEVQQTIENLTATAVEYRNAAQAAVDEFNAVNAMKLELSTDWRRTILWTELADYWPSETSYDNHRACYYGYVDTSSTDQLNLVETSTGEASVVSEGIETSQTRIDETQGGDSRGRSWDIFQVNDYNWMVQHNLVPPRPGGHPTNDTQVGDYLCGGESPLIYEGTTFIRESGSSIIEYEDEEDLFVGNYDYGQWCRTNPDDGTVQQVFEEGEILDADEDLSWCWYMPENGDTRYYYTREYNSSSNTYIFYNRGYRCYYCGQSSWSGSGGIAPDSNLANINQTGRTVVTGPSDISGGPTAGK